MTQPDEVPQYRVVSRGGQLLFSGTEENARQYVEDNFPRLHVQPGSVNEPEPDAVVRTPDGENHYFAGADGRGWVTPHDDDDADTLGDDDDDDEVSDDDDDDEDDGSSNV